MLWTLGRSPGEGIEIDRGAPRIFSNSASVGKGKENAVYRFQRYSALQSKLEGTKLPRRFLWMDLNRGFQNDNSLIFDSSDISTGFNV